jgi:hypothetical protein
LHRITDSLDNVEKRPTLAKFPVSYKVKVKLSLCLTKYHAMKAYWGVEVQLHAVLDLGIRWR